MSSLNLLWRPRTPLFHTSTLPLLAIFSLAVGGFCIGTTEFVAMGLIQEIANNLNITVPEAGHFISAYALRVVIGAPIIAILGAKVPRKLYCSAVLWCSECLYCFSSYT